MKNIKNLLHVATNHVKSYYSLFAAALVLSIFPIVLPFLGKMAGFITDHKDTAGVIAFALMLCTSIGFSGLVGMSSLGTDLTNRKMNFYFARPLPSWVVWGGKVLGSLVTVFGGGIIILLPTFMLFNDVSQPIVSLQLVVDYTSVTLFCLGLGLIGGVMFRSKSFLLMLDLALAPVLAILGGIAFWQVILNFKGRYFLERINFGENFNIVAGLVAFLGIVMIASSGAGLILGRTDIKQVHRALSVSLWAVLSFVVLSGFGFTAWIVSASPKDMTQVSSAYFLPNGKWVLLSGHTWGRGEYLPKFLLNTNTQEYIKLSEESGLSVSSDGAKAILVERNGLLNKEFHVAKMDLSKDKIEFVDTKIALAEEGQWALSKDGSQAVFARKNLVTVFDLNQNKEVTTTHFPELEKNWLYNILFLNSDTVRFYLGKLESTNHVASIFELDIPNKKIAKVGGYTDGQFYSTKVSNDGNQIISFSNKTVLNGKTGEEIAKLPLSDPEKLNGFTFASNNRVAFTERSKEGITLKIFSPNTSTVENSIFLEKAASAYLVNQLNDQEVVVNILPLQNAVSDYEKYKWQIAIANLKTGKVDVKVKGLKPAYRYFWERENNPENTESMPYFITEKGLVKVDVVNSEQKLIHSLGFAK